MLEDDSGRLIHEVFEDIEAVVHVGKIDLARMLAHLQHVIHSEGAYQPPARLDETTVAQNQVAVHQLVKGRLLVRIFSVAQTAFLRFARLIRDRPGFFVIEQGLAAQSDGHLWGEGITPEGGIHFF